MQGGVAQLGGGGSIRRLSIERKKFNWKVIYCFRLWEGGNSKNHHYFRLWWRGVCEDFN